MIELCSYCLQTSKNCRCENYHPPILAGINKQLASKLIDFFDSVGWISYEDWLEIHMFVRELNKFTSKEV